MAWLSDLIDGSVIYAADINDRYGISGGKQTWRGDVDAAGHSLDNLASLGATNMTGRLSLINSLAEDAVRIGSGANYYQIGRGGVTGYLTYVGVQQSFSGYQWWVKDSGGNTEAVMVVDNNGHMSLFNMPSSNPGAGSKKLWYDPADGNRVKFAA